MGVWILGADCTTPSSTTATALQPVGGWQPDVPTSGSGCTLLVRSPNSLPPLLLKSRMTCHCPSPRWSTVAVAVRTSVPSTTAGPRRYLVVPLRSHATMSAFGLSTPPLCRLISVAQSMVAKRCANAALLLGDGVGDAVVVGPAVGFAVGVGVAARAASGREDSAGTARPLPVFVGVGLGEAVVPGEADGEADGVAVAPRVAPGLAAGVGGVAGPAASTCRNRSWAVRRTRSRTSLRPRPGTDTTML